MSLRQDLREQVLNKTMTKRVMEINIRVLLFRIGKEFYAINSMYIQAVVHDQRISPVSEEDAPEDFPRDENIIGIITPQGLSAPVYSLHRCFNVPEPSGTLDMLLIRNGNHPLAIPIDEIGNMTDVSGDDVKKIPFIVENINQPFLESLINIDKRPIFLINPYLLLD